MRIAKVVGQVTLSRHHESLVGGSFKLAEPQSLDNLVDRSDQAADVLVVYDEFGAATGNLIMLTEGSEAAQPFRPEIKPVDAYNAGILDAVDIRLEHVAHYHP